MTKRWSTVVALTLSTVLYLLGLNDDADYYLHRRLKPTLNPRSCSVAARPSCDDGVLVSSQGGVGSSKFIIALERAAALGHGTGFCTNDERDFDGFKHLPAGAWRHNATAVVHRSTESGRETCFGKILVIVGDPVHTIESTYRRFKMEHVAKLQRAAGLPDYPRSMPLGALYENIAASGRDLTGITSYVDSWLEASRDHAHWPEMRLVTVRTLYEHAAEHARWIGVEEGGQDLFSRLDFDPSREYGTDMSAGSEDVREKVMTALSNVTRAVRLVENTSPSGRDPRESEKMFTA